MQAHATSKRPRVVSEVRSFIELALTLDVDPIFALTYEIVTLRSKVAVFILSLPLLRRFIRLPLLHCTLTWQRFFNVSLHLPSFSFYYYLMYLDILYGFILHIVWTLALIFWWSCLFKFSFVMDVALMIMFHIYMFMDFSFPLSSWVYTLFIIIFSLITKGEKLWMW